MFRESCWNKYRGHIIFILSVLIIIPSIIFGSIGAWAYVKLKHDQSVYKPTMCFVKNYTITESKCPTESCSWGCTTVYEPCYLEIYIVIYNVSNGRELQSTIKTTDGSGPHSVSI
jgi:hypothetical protein